MLELPVLQRYTARDGARLAYRTYGTIAHPSKGSVVLVHGSSSRSDGMHPMAMGFLQAGYTVYSLDMRGHGESGVKGQIAYIGQLEDDLEGFLNTVKPAGKKTLVGFSSGGGFALRFAGSARQKMFDQYLLVSPFIHQDAATSRPGSGGWAATGVPRVIGLTILNRIGITAFNKLPVIKFALTAEAEKSLTPTYSYALEQNFRPHDVYRSDIRAASQPMQVLVGQDDELFNTAHFEAVFNETGMHIPVTIVPEMGHIDIILKPVAIQAAVAAVQRLNNLSNPANK